MPAACHADTLVCALHVPAMWLCSAARRASSGYKDTWWHAREVLRQFVTRCYAPCMCLPAATHTTMRVVSLRVWPAH